MQSQCARVVEALARLISRLIQSLVEDSDIQSMKVAKRDTKYLCKICIYVHIYMGKQGNSFEATHSTFYIVHIGERVVSNKKPKKQASAPP